MKSYKIVKVIGQDVTVEFSLDDGTVSTQTIAVRPYILGTTVIGERGKEASISSIVDPTSDAQGYIEQYGKRFEGDFFAHKQAQEAQKLNIDSLVGKTIEVKAEPPISSVEEAAV